MRHRKKLARGQTAVIITLVIGVLLGAMTLGTDVGLFYYNWMLLQKAADASVVAGANNLTALPDPSGTIAASAISTAEGYACLNGINDPSNTNTTICPNPIRNADYVDHVASTNVDSNDTQLSIRLTRQVPYFFGRVLGLNSGSVAAFATAQVGRGVNTFTSGLFPAGVQCDKPCSSITDMNPGQSVVFGQKFAGGLAPGNWQWLNLGQGMGAPQLADAIANGVAGSYSIGDNISSTTGNKFNASVVRDGFQARVDQHNSKFPSVDYTKVCADDGNPGNIPLGDPLLVTIPAVDFGGCKGNCSMAIEGFAEVYLTGMSVSRGGNATIDGCFVQEVAPGSVGSASAPVLGSLSPPILVE